MKSKTVLVTGFGPFGLHKVNASWEACKELLNLSKAEQDECPFELQIKEIPVDYDYISKVVSELWDTYKPDIVIHVGVHGQATSVLLEQCAYKGNHVQKDINGYCPQNGCCLSDVSSEWCLKTQLDLNAITEFVRLKYASAEVSHLSGAVTVAVSDDAGRFLCNFSYYHSLSIDARRSLFIHVPMLNHPYSAEQLAHCIRLIILAILQQLDEAV